jgi:hypothetical protein
MTPPPPPEEEKPSAPDEAADDAPPPEDDADAEAIRALLKRSIDVGASVPSTRDVSEASKDSAILRGVQKKLRARSKGKFYGDGWSTTQSRINYALVAVAMLLVIAVAYFALGPMGISAH